MASPYLLGLLDFGSQFWAVDFQLYDEGGREYGLFPSSWFLISDGLALPHGKLAFVWGCIALAMTYNEVSALDIFRFVCHTFENVKFFQSIIDKVNKNLK